MRAAGVEGVVEYPVRAAAAVEAFLVWRLNPATLQWEPMPALVTARDGHACCVVRGTLVVLGGNTSALGGLTSSVEIATADSPSSAAAAMLLPRPRARRWRSATTTMNTGCLRCPCTTHGSDLHARLLRDASSSPEGMVTNRLKSTMSRWVGGFGFRATCLTPVGWHSWAARFCRRAGNALA